MKFGDKVGYIYISLYIVNKEVEGLGSCFFVFCVLWCYIYIVKISVCIIFYLCNLYVFY